jgi:hypothetical protein
VTDDRQDLDVGMVERRETLERPSEPLVVSAIGDDQRERQGRWLAFGIAGRGSRWRPPGVQHAPQPDGRDGGECDRQKRQQRHPDHAREIQPRGLQHTRTIPGVVAPGGPRVRRVAGLILRVEDDHVVVVRRLQDRRLVGRRSSAGRLRVTAGTRGCGGSGDDDQERAEKPSGDGGAERPGRHAVVLRQRALPPAETERPPRRTCPNG